MPTPTRNVSSTAVVVTCSLAFVGAVVVASVYGVKSYLVEQEIARIPATDSQRFSEAIKTGITHTSDASHSLAQTILLISAALWGLIIGKDEERKLILGRWYSCLMAIVANLVVLAFLFSYHVLDTVLSRILYTSAVVGGQEYILNIDNMRLSDLFSYQLYIFIAATVAIGSTLLTAHALKRGP